MYIYTCPGDCAKVIQPVARDHRIRLFQNVIFSIATLFCTYDNPNSQYLTRLLLKPF